jgi:hypothetical protein
MAGGIIASGGIICAIPPACIETGAECGRNILRPIMFALFILSPKAEQSGALSAAIRG